MPTTATGGARLSKTQIQTWSTSHLSDAAANWRAAATTSENLFDQHRTNVASPGGTTWEGAAKDAALDRVTNDTVVVSRQSGALREAAALADSGAHDINNAQSEAVAAITAAEDDDFSVGEDLKVTDTRRYDITTIADRNKALAEHAEDIRWYADRLIQTDTHVGERLWGKAAELDGIKFDGEDEDRSASTGRVYLVDNKVKHDAEGKDQPGEKKPEVPAQSPGQIGPFAVPKSVEDAAKKPEAKPAGEASGPEAGSRTPRSLEDMMLPGGRADRNAMAPKVDPNSPEGKQIAAARQSLLASGRSPEEVERTINNVFGGANEKYTPPEGPTAPRPDLDDGAGATLRGTEGFVRDLLGQDGMESFKDAWKGVGSNLYETAKDPYGTLVRGIGDEFHAAADNPAYWAGGKLAEAGIAGATLPLGPEALAARGALDDVVRAGVPHEVVHTPTHVDTPSPHVEHPAPLTSEAPAGHSAPPSAHAPLPDDGLNHVVTDSGGPGGWNQELNRPAPNTHYVVDDRFSYTTDSEGRVTHAEMTYDSTHEPGDRNTYQQRIAGGEDRLPNDHGGHIFGTQFGAPGEGINITAMRDTLNAIGDRDYYNLEQQWRVYAADGGEVRAVVDITHPEGSKRPDMYSVETYVDGQLKSTYHFDN